MTGASTGGGRKSGTSKPPPVTSAAAGRPAPIVRPVPLRSPFTPPVAAPEVTVSSRLTTAIGSLVGRCGEIFVSHVFFTEIDESSRRPRDAEVPFLLGTLMGKEVDPQTQKEDATRRQSHGSFHSRRHLALLRPWRAVDVLQPYARLRLDILSATRLMPGDIGGTSDPFVEVYVDDELTHTGPVRNFTLNPKWNWSVELEIYSVLAHVQVRVLDKDRFTANDHLGFVEFQVADLEPGRQVGGRFELRRPEKLLGFAHSRIRHHMRCRDEDHPPVGKALGDKDVVDSKRAEHSPGGASQGSTSTLSSLLKSPKGKAKAPLAPTVASEQLAHESSEQTNGGYIRMSLHLTPCTFPEDDWDEWLSYCLPRPKEEYYEREDSIDTHNFYVLCETVKHMFDRSFLRAYSMLAYIVTWRCWWLSASILMWWWTCCLHSFIFWPSLPLWLGFLLFLLRKPQWRRAMMIHPSWAALNQEGLVQIASTQDSAKVAHWLERVVESLGGRSTDHTELHRFAASIFRRGRPLLHFNERSEKESLSVLLRMQPWISWDRGLPLCPQGHRLHHKGTESDGWSCQQIHGHGCRYLLHEDETNMESSSCGFELGHFHCSTCDFTLCEDCVTKRHSGSLIRYVPFPSGILPKTMVLYMHHLETFLERCRRYLSQFLRKVLVLFDVTEYSAQLAQHVYRGCGAASVIILCAQEFLGFAIVDLIKVIWILLGTIVLAANMPLTNRLWTAFCAQTHYKGFRKRRQRGGCVKYWAFFQWEVDPDHHHPEHHPQQQQHPDSEHEVVKPQSSSASH